MRMRFLSRVFNASGTRLATDDAQESAGDTTGIDDAIATIRTEFDAGFYLERYPDVNAAGIDPVIHYVDFGARECRDPTPNFNTRFYRDTYPEVVEAGQNPFLHFIQEGRRKGFAPNEQAWWCQQMFDDASRAHEEIDAHIRARHKDIEERLRSGALARMVRSAAEIEPSVMHPARDSVTLQLPPVVSGARTPIAAMSKAQKQAEGVRAKAVVCIPHCRMSGAARVAAMLTHALADKLGTENVVVLRTDLPDMDYPGWFPRGVRSVDISDPKRLVGPHMRQRLLFEFLRSLEPQHVFNVNSRLFWDSSVRFGQPMSDAFDCYAYLFCSDRNMAGHEAGYPVEFFYRCYDDLAGVITDSRFLEETLRTRFCVAHTDTRLRALATPMVDPPRKVGFAAKDQTSRSRVFWGGRFDRQKRLDIVFAIARRMPAVDFSLWGKAIIGQPFDDSDVPDNVTLEGTYDSFSDLPLEHCDAWLYTAQWDGVPTILMDVAAAGIPVVGSLVGGTGEILDPDLSWPVSDIEDVDAFENGLRAVLSDLDGARRKAARLSDKVRRERTPDDYAERLWSFLNENGTRS